MMKNFSLSTFLLTLLISAYKVSAIAEECESNQPPVCEYSFCDGKFKIGADWLYWKTTLTNENAGVLSTSSIPGITDTTAITVSKAIYPHFKYDSGFRVLLDYTLPDESWEVGATYNYIDTHVKSREVSTISTPTTAQTITTILGPTEVPALTYQNKTTINFSYLDLDIAKTITCCNKFSLRPHIGFRAAWLRQKSKSLFTLASSTAISTNIGLNSFPIHFEGYGIQGGIGGEWKADSNVSILGQIGGSLLYSKFRTSYHSRETDTPVGATPVIVFLQDNDYNFKTNTPSFDYSIALNYTYQMCESVVDLYIGWEQHVFFNLQHQNAAISGNLALQGLNLGLNISF